MPEQPELTTVLALFAARMAGGYAICLGLVGPRVKEGAWRSVSLRICSSCQRPKR